MSDIARCVWRAVEVRGIGVTWCPLLLAYVVNRLGNTKAAVFIAALLAVFIQAVSSSSASSAEMNSSDPMVMMKRAGEECRVWAEVSIARGGYSCTAYQTTATFGVNEMACPPVFG